MYVRLALPMLGRTRSASTNLHAQRGGVDEVLATAVRIAHEAEDGAGAAPMTALVEAVLMVLSDQTDTEFEPHRERVAALARFGWAVGAAEDAGVHCAAGLTHPHVDTALLYLALENRVEDPMAKAVTDWVLEAAYYLRRTSQALPEVLTTLFIELPALFPSRLRPVEVVAVPVAVPAAAQFALLGGLPTQRGAADHQRAVSVGARGGGAA